MLRNEFCLIFEEDYVESLELFPLLYYLSELLFLLESTYIFLISSFLFPTHGLRWLFILNPIFCLLNA